ncbi:hypothetical protein GA0115261_110802, partial [Streptomyces sp. OspMP-M43]
LIGALLMSGRGRQVRRSRRDREREPVEPYAAPAADQVDTWPPTQEPGMSVQTTPWPEPEVDPYTGPDPRAPGTRSYPQADPHPEDDPRDPVHPPHRPPRG